MVAEIQSITLLVLFVVVHELGSPAVQLRARACSLGESAYTYSTLPPISSPATRNTHFLCRDRVTSHGTDERIDATVAPSPMRTKSDGSAQHRSVPKEVKSER